MIFLIEYDRHKGRIVKFKSFQKSKQHVAENLRFNIELELNRKAINHEVVLLDAESKAALKMTHQRYFENTNRILKIT